jgi:hypothetical protein
MRAALLLLLTACGRLGFNSGEPAVDAHGTDGVNPDGTTEFCTTGAPATCPTGAAFCEDFETSTGASFPKWDSLAIKNWYTNGAADPATSLQANNTSCRGTSAAHGHAVGSAQVAFLHKAIAARPNPLYVRLWFRINGSSPDSNFEIMGVHDSFDAEFINVGVDRSQQMFGVNIVGFSSSAAGMLSPAAFVADRWMCLELGVRFDSTAAGRIQLWLDDVPSFDMTNVITQGTMPLDNVLLGVVTGMNELGTFDIGLDEIAVSGSRIGCN